MARLKAKHRRKCNAKARYDSEAEARDTAARFFWDQYPYRCKGCDRWHLTSTKPWSEA